MERITQSIGGGELELRKCFYYVLACKCDDNGTPYASSIQEQRATCDQIMIQGLETSQKEVEADHTTLGVKKTISGMRRVKMHSYDKEARCMII
jgi:hypothetical protein